jgi:undecaprenyl-phosphate 4-deoxy-4-formamido-L-arabinose transferase
MTKISIVVPVYSGEKTIVPLVEKIDPVLSGKYDWEAILVFDRGKDGSWEKISELCKHYPSRVFGYSLASNYGQQRSLMFGLSKACGDYIVTMDEDLQHDPEYIPKLINEIESGDYDIVYGRFRSLEQPGSRKVFSRLLRKILVRFIPHLNNDYSPYRIIRKEIAEKVIGMNGTITFLDDYLSRVSKKFGLVELEHRARPGGKSSTRTFGAGYLGNICIYPYRSSTNNSRLNIINTTGDLI